MTKLYRCLSYVEIIERTDQGIPFPRLPITVPSLLPNGVSSRRYPRVSKRGSLIDYKMWFLSRCLSIDSFYSCLHPDRHRKSYDFCFCPDRLKIFPAKCDNEEIDGFCSKKPLRYQRPPFRRRLPKRYSDIVGPMANKAVFFTNEPCFGSYQTRRASIHLQRRHSSKPTGQETVQYLRSSRRKARQVIPSFTYMKLPEFRNGVVKPKRPSDDLLAHRMQAVMSSELMHSLDRNFVFGDRSKHHPHYSLMTRSQSFNVCTLSNNYTRKAHSNFYHQLIPRAQLHFKQEEEFTITELTPDYNEQFILRKSLSKISAAEGKESLNSTENPLPTAIPELDEKTSTHTEQNLSSAFIIPPNGDDATKKDEESSTPAPPLKPTVTPKTYLTVRCRTIADYLTPDHKLILKDEPGPSPNPSPPPSVSSFPPPPESISSYASLPQADPDDTEMTTICARPVANADDSLHDANLSSSSPATSVLVDHDYEPRSSSSKIYHDYKKRTSSISIPTTSTRLSNPTMIVHPMHTRIGLRSSTSSSSTRNQRFSADMTSVGKQMNVCVINQLNEHLSTRFRQQAQQQQQQQHQKKEEQEQEPSETYDLPPAEKQISSSNPIETNQNVYDEPNELLMTDNPIGSTIAPTSSIPPPPPPLPIGGFRSIKTSISQLAPVSRTDRLSSPRTSTASSNLSDTRILHELRANPLFTRAKEHLDVDADSSACRSERSSIDSRANSDKNEKTSPYVQLNDFSTSHHRTSPPKKSTMETIILHPSELNRMLGKRTKSSNDVNQAKAFRSLPATPCRQSELELIFQKRAQRQAQNLS